LYKSAQTLLLDRGSIASVRRDLKAAPPSALEHKARWMRFFPGSPLAARSPCQRPNTCDSTRDSGTELWPDQGFVLTEESV